MPDSSGSPAHIEVVFSQRPRQVVTIGELPFLVGRGSENGNHLALDDLRVSRRCVAISASPEGLRIADRGQAGGVFVNRSPVTEPRILRDGDLIRIGGDDECQLVFRSAAPANSHQDRRTTLGDPPLGDLVQGDSHHELNRLSLLLEATSLLHSQLPLDSIFATMLDHAVAITRADRGMLLEPDASGNLQVRVARGRERKELSPAAMNPSRTVLRQAVEQRSAVVNEDLRMADTDIQTAHSVILQFLRSAVVIPLFNMPHSGEASARNSGQGELLGALYLDSRQAFAFSTLDRQILDVLGAQAANILDNARLMLRERERQRLEQELSIARQIQQALVPQGLQDFPHLAITGMHRPCHEVGGDYFDVFPLHDGRTAILIADVSGKGLGAALLTTMLQGALSGLTFGSDPVQVFEHLNRFLCERSVVGRYATMFFGMLAPDGLLEFVRAGHPSPLLLRRGQVSELYQEGSFPIGLVDVASFEACRIQLEPGDTLLLFTDGVTEAEDKNRNLFEIERLIEALSHHAGCSIDALQSGLLAAVEQFTEGAIQSDDLTLLLAQYRKPAETIAAADTGIAVQPASLL
jgi:serine phosphatase RsbU (regulator of sigma subunit)